MDKTDYSVTIDAGHGGHDSGATFSNTEEKDSNLLMSLAVGMNLKKRGVRVRFTRLSDEFISIQKRVDMSESAGTDMLVSFHRYGKGNTGVGVIVGDNNKTGEVMATSKGLLMRLPRPEYETELAEKIIRRFQKVWRASLQDREVILEGRDTKLKTLGLFAQQSVQKPTFIVELGSVKHRDTDFYNNNFDEIAAAATDGIYDALAENRKQIERRTAHDKRSFAVTKNSALQTKHSVVK
jgi:N-acetylmuramoyl-L-alanine amidase